MRSHNDSIDTTHTPPPLSFYNTFKLQHFLYKVLKDNRRKGFTALVILLMFQMTH
jgi:hypothetical protein